MLDKEYLKEGGQLNDAMVEALVLSDLLKDSKQGRDAAKSRGLKELTAWVPPIPPLSFGSCRCTPDPCAPLPDFSFQGFRVGISVYQKSNVRLLMFSLPTRTTEQR